MKTSNVLSWLSWLVAVLALVAAGAGLFWREGDGPFPFTTLHGETVQMYGQGLYRNNSLFIGAGFKGQDMVTLVLGVPLLALSILLYRRSSLGGGLLLMGMLGYFLYVYASMALGTAYNHLFLIYIALFSASLHAFALAWLSIDRQVLLARLSRGGPRRSSDRVRDLVHRRRNRGSNWRVSGYGPVCYLDHLQPAAPGLESGG